MSENQSTGYNPFNIAQPNGAGFNVTFGAGGSDCFYGSYGNGQVTLVFPDGTQYKQDAASLRQYILDLEANRRLQDLIDVDFTRNVQPGDTLVYNYTTGKWELSDFISPGEF